MAVLCFTKKLVITDTALNLNRAFRTLIYKNEGEEYYKEDYYKQYLADFFWLMKKVYIRVALRDSFDGCFSNLFRESKKNMKHIEFPSEGYIEFIDEICPREYVKTYNIHKASMKFSSTFKNEINN